MPGGVGFDINCGVRLIRTNLTEKDVAEVKEKLTQSLFDHIPVGACVLKGVGTRIDDHNPLTPFLLCHAMMRTGVGSKGVIPTSAADLEAALEMGMDWSLREGYAWAEDKEHCEEYGRMLQVTQQTKAGPNSRKHSENPKKQNTHTHPRNINKHRPTRPRWARGRRSAGCRSWARWGRGTTTRRSRWWTRSWTQGRRPAWGSTGSGRCVCRVARDERRHSVGRSVVCGAV